MARQVAQGSNKQEKTVHNIISQGQLLPVKVVTELVYRALQGIGDHFILDGFPRNIEQFQNWEKICAYHK